MNFWGIFCGLNAAVLMAVAFLCSSAAVRRHPQLGTVGLLARAHVIMGVLGALLLPAVWSPALLSGVRVWLPVTLGGVFAYLIGQGGMFMAQRSAASSRLVPLLGLKLIFLAFINAVILRSEVYGFWQFAGIACTLLAAVVLNRTGGPLPWTSLGWVILACSGFSLSDTFIRALAQVLGDLGVAGLQQQAMLGVCLSYIGSGLIGLLLLPAGGRHQGQVWLHITPFAVSWIISIVFLFACFALIGTVSGNIVQSTRGLWAIVLGALVGRAGHTALEEKAPWSLVGRRLGAALLMFLAIILFNRS